MQYPTITEVENCLKIIASEVGDTMDAPFRVDMVARYGGKPPLYTAADKEPIRQKLSQVLDRKFSLGATSFALNATEAQVILQYQAARRSNT